ncbi:hypothetical protein GQ43DRAFT_159766 [Delitschia confertaspora ATCC 74209]|uniref:Uncharacterized protein n=1 Tax=Delitschia confertaspora ATCC 74209 TaxID=1513339 RepID=A0A9P4N045_9PLEO|nr:hypothetical protein GQ43DRAFT_159766 [Delitschia confertaspora ATCC 74209]
MTAVMAPAQPGLSLAAPPDNRQDVISALLNDYSTFGHSDGSTSPYYYAPAPPVKELPRPPPKDRERKREKPLPPLMMRFQLRVDEPTSSNSNPTSLPKFSSPHQSHPTTISYRAISRRLKPPSLKLPFSNGSTATLPPPPSQSTPANPTPAEKALPKTQNRPLPTLPPSPPAKSERREMGNKQSKGSKEEMRSDEEMKVDEKKSNLVKRRPVPNSQSGDSNSGEGKKKTARKMLQRRYCRAGFR